MNAVVLTGRATRDAEIRWTTGNEPMCVARFTIAVRKKVVKEGGDSADFINCVAFGKKAEFAERYVRKGTRIEIKGSITTDSYTNKEGQKVYTTEVHVDDIEFGESKQASEASSGGNNGGSQNYYGNGNGSGGNYVNNSGGSYGGGNQNRNQGNNFGNNQRPNAQPQGNGYSQIPMDGGNGFNGRFTGR